MVDLLKKMFLLCFSVAVMISEIGSATAQKQDTRAHLGKSYWTRDKLIRYAIQHTERLDPLHKQLAQETVRYPRGGMLGDPQVVLLNMNLMRAIGAKRVLDVGLFTGFSAMGAALAIPTNGTVIGMDITDQYWNEVGKKYAQAAGVERKIQLAIQPANQTLYGLLAAGEQGTWDFCFIDADKAGYENYYEKCVQLLRPGGIITLDNVFWGGSVAETQFPDATAAILDRLNKIVANDSRVWKNLLPVADGLTVIVKK